MSRTLINELRAQRAIRLTELQRCLSDIREIEAAIKALTEDGSVTLTEKKALTGTTKPVRYKKRAPSRANHLNNPENTAKRVAAIAVNKAKSQP